MIEPKTIPLKAPALQIEGYENFSPVGEGGYGVVYSARQTSTGQQVAVKMLKLNGETDEPTRKYQVARFDRETKLCAELNHPHIVRLLDKGHTDKGVPFAVFEYIEGESLKDLIVRNGGLSAADTGELMGQVLDALAAAHAKGIVHRDLKPHNIMVQQSGSQKHVRILDFGIGAFTREFRSNDYQSLTLTREVMGTPAYSAPEQLRGEPATVKSDLYAWGLVTIECLTGIPVMKDDSVAEVFKLQLNAENVPLPPAIAGHPLADLLRRVLHKNARLRSGDASVLFQDFRKINFNTLVGQISTYARTRETPGEDAATMANPLGWQDRRSEKRQITVLGVRLNLNISEAAGLDLETRDAISKDQLNLLQDTAVRFGGHLAGRVGNQLLIYFGYPTVSDTDARRAGRAALEMTSEVRRRSALLDAKHGVQLSTKMTIHTGVVLSRPNQLPEGTVPNHTIDLLYQTPAGSILVSPETKKLLDPYLEFEAGEKVKTNDWGEAVQSWFITGERQTEALSFLRPWSANREMVGRNEDRDMLMELWDQVQNGTGKAIVLHGQAGIGKSKMVYEGKKQVRSDGFLFRECRCLPEHQNNALFPFLDMLRNHWGIKGLQNNQEIFTQLKNHLEEAGVEVETGLPILCFWLNIALPEGITLPEVTPDVQKQILFELLRKSLVHIGRENPFLLVLEDLHWLDPTGQEFVEYLLAELPQHSFFLLMTTRPVFIPEWEQDHLHYHELQPLEDSSVEILVRAVLDGKNIAPDALKYIDGRADGIPLYLEELTRMLVEEEYLVLREDSYQFDEQTDIQEIPGTLQDLLNARLDRLGLAKESAQIAATIGREFDYELLVRASLRDEASVQHDLDSLMDADLIYRVRKTDSDNYIFRHALIRDAAYDGMLAGARRGHHLRVAETLKAHFPENVEDNPFEVARHLAGGGEFEEGSEFGIKAVEKQVEINSHVEAERTVDGIREWIKALAEGGRKAQLELTLNNASIAARMAIDGYGNERVFELNKKNESLLETLRTSKYDISGPELEELTQKTQWTTFVYYHFANKRKEAGALATKILKSYKESPNDENELGMLPLIAQGVHAEGDLEGSEILFNRILQLARKKSERKLEVEYAMEPVSAAYFFMGQTRLCLGFPETAMDYMLKSIEVGESAGHSMSITLGYTYLVWLAFQLGDLDMVLKYYHEFIDKYPEQQENLWVFSHLKMCGECAEGRTEYPEQYVSDILASGQHFSLSWYEVLLSSTYMRLGEPEKAASLMEKSVSRSRKEGEGWTLPIIKKALAEAWLGSDPSKGMESKELLKEALEDSRKMKALWFELEVLWSLVNHFPSSEISSQLQLARKRLAQGEKYPLVQKIDEFLSGIENESN